MDVSSKSFMVHAVNEKKRVVFSGEVTPTRSGLDRMLRELGSQQKLVAFEAGNQMKWIAEHLLKKDTVTPHVVHPNEVKWITESRGKTDKVDAKKLAELGRGDMLPRAVHIVQGKVRELRELVSARHLLQSKRVAMINALRGFVFQEGLRLPAKFFSQKNWKEKLEAFKASAPLKQILASYMSAIEALAKSEKELSERICAIDDERIELLKTIPAIGELSSRVLLSAIDDASRFDDKKAVANYGALTPTIYQSGAVTKLGRINRDGRHEVRRVLLQCAHTITRMKSPAVRPLKEFYERIAKKRGKKIAIVALSRKLLTTAYGVLKTGSTYDPAKLAA
jgi:transposase